MHSLVLFRFNSIIFKKFSVVLNILHVDYKGFTGHQNFNLECKTVKLRKLTIAVQEKLEYLDK